MKSYTAKGLNTFRHATRLNTSTLPVIWGLQQGVEESWVATPMDFQWSIMCVLHGSKWIGGTLRTPLSGILAIFFVRLLSCSDFTELHRGTCNTVNLEAGVITCRKAGLTDIWKCNSLCYFLASVSHDLIFVLGKVKITSNKSVVNALMLNTTATFCLQSQEPPLLSQHLFSLFLSAHLSIFKWGTLSLQW